MDEKYYLLKIQLLEIKPIIWREFFVPASISLDRLHEVIQDVMGWANYHLYEFEINGTIYTEEPESPEEGLKSKKYKLGDLVSAKGEKFKYTYDFGDNWVHLIELIDCIDMVPDPKSPVRCLAGKRACPPEDVGGPWGYKEFLGILKNPNHEEYEEVVDWAGGDFDSERFVLDWINEELEKYRFNTRKKKKSNE